MHLSLIICNYKDNPNRRIRHSQIMTRVFYIALIRSCLDDNSEFFFCYAAYRTLKWLPKSDGTTGDMPLVGAGFDIMPR